MSLHSLSKDEIDTIIKNLKNKQDLLNVAIALPDKYRPTIYKKIFEIEFPYTKLDDIPKMYRTDYESATNYMFKIFSDTYEKTTGEYKDCVIKRRLNKCLMIPVNINPHLSVFEHFWKEFKNEYLEYVDAIDDMYNSKDRMRDNILLNEKCINDFMISMMVGLKLIGRRNSMIYYELPLSRKYLFSQMLIEHELIPLIPQVADCIVDLNELGYREHGKYWCMQREGEKFVIGGRDCESYSDYGTIPKEISFPTYLPEYFWDIVSYNRVLRIDTNHPEIREQLKKQRNNSRIELKTTCPPNYLLAESDNAGRNREIDYFNYVAFDNDELRFY